MNKADIKQLTKIHDNYDRKYEQYTQDSYITDDKEKKLKCLAQADLCYRITYDINKLLDN